MESAAVNAIEPWHIADGVSAITPDRLKNLLKAAGRTRGIHGDNAELGVYKGGSAKILAEMWPDRTLHLFDTFMGLPRSEKAELDPEGYVKEGMFAASISEVREYLKGLNVLFHAGEFPVSAFNFPPTKFAFVHIDCDLGDTAAEAIAWFWPRLSEGGIMFFDDYGCKFTGVTRAVDAAFAPEQIEKQYDMYGNQIGALVVK